MNLKADFTKLLLTGFFIIAMRLVAFANTVTDGYEIKVKFDDYGKDTLFLGFQMGNQTYIRDTAVLNKSSGFFTFKGEEKLKTGIYFIVSQSNDICFQLIINDQEQSFSLITTKQEPYAKAKLKDTKDNDIFFNYMTYIAEKTKDADKAKSLKSVDSINAIKKLTTLDDEVKSFQHDLVKKHENTVSSMLIKSTFEVEVPIYDNIKDKDERKLARYYHYKNHYFDNFDMANPAMLRSPVLFQRIDYFIEKLTPQHPDSILQSLDHIFQLIKPSKETFQFYFAHYLNQYAQTKLVGFDAIYVNLAKKYIDSGETDYFIEKDRKEKILKNAAKLYPTLIGKVAPNITVFIQDSVYNEKVNKRISLHDVKAKYTILFFYAPDCGHCKKQSPDLVAFFKKAKEQKLDMKVFATCTYKTEDKMPECMQYIQEKGFGDFINTMDPHMISRYFTLYNVELTPQLFVLDENKVIRSKNIDTKQLSDVMDFLIQEDNEKVKKR